MKPSISGYVELLARRGRIFMAVVALLMVFCLVGIFRLSIDTEFTVFMSTHSAYVDAANEMDRAFGDSDQLLVLVGTDGSVSSLKGLSSLVDRYSTIGGVSEVESAIPSSFADLPDNQFLQRLDMFKEVTGGATLRDFGGKTWASMRLMLVPGGHPRQVIRKIRSINSEAGYDYVLSGEPYLQAQIFDYILRIILILPPIAIVLMLGVFRIRIGSARATVLSMIPAIIGAVLTLGSVSWALGNISIVSVLVPIFVIVLGSADGLHITSHVMDLISKGKDNKEAVKETLNAVGVPVIMTTVTTMAGFLSELVIDSPAIRQMGVTAAGGIFLAGVATWVVLPVLLLHQKPLVLKRRRETGRIAAALSTLRGWPSVLISLVLIAAAVPGMLKLRSSFSMIDIYKPSTEVRKNIDRTTQILGGAIPVYVLFHAENPFDPKVASAVLDFQDKVKKKGLTGESVSLYSVLSRAALAFTGHEGYPPNATVAGVLGKQIAAMSPSFSSSFVSGNGLGRAVFFLSNLENNTLGTFVSLAREESQKSGIDIRPVGTAFAMKEMNDRIIPQQVGSLILAAGLVLLLTALTQRSLWLGFAAVTPILITLLGLFGTMGYAGIDLSVITGIMSGLTIGVGIDYAIHYVSLYRYARTRNDPNAVESALGYVATPVLANALGLAIGFTAMVFSPLQIHVTLSVLMWVTMVLSAFLSLTLLPTLLGRRSSRAGTTSGAGGTPAG